jgi:2,3-bisphosphoglycerate-dependent phosphoglycerate mutase
LEVLYLVRHGQTEWNRDRRMQGRRDSPLTDAGIAHARSHAALMAGENVEHLLVSPLGRARDTARLINTVCRVGVTVDERLAERAYGAWEGLTWAEIEAGYEAELRAHVADPFYHRPPGGENLPDVVDRVAPLIGDLRALPHRRVAIVSHGICGRALLTHLLGLDPAQASAARQPNELVYRLTFESTPRCEHFLDGAGPHPGLFTNRP